MEGYYHSAVGVESGGGLNDGVRSGVQEILVWNSGGLNCRSECGIETLKDC